MTYKETSNGETNATEEATKDMTALFSKQTINDDGEEEDDGELFRDRVRAVFEHFDVDQDGYLKFEELKALQKATAGTDLTEEMFLMACRALDCKPQTGIHLQALKLTYASEGSDIEKDYYKVFTDKTKPEIIEDPDRVYELGADGFDISSS